MSNEAQCKICFKEANTTQPFTNSYTQIEGCKYLLSDCLMGITGFTAADMDLVKRICFECETDLVQAYTFRIKSVSALEKLKQVKLNFEDDILLQSPTIKVEDFELQRIIDQPKQVKVKREKKTVIDTPLPLICAHCDKLFSSKKNLRFHLHRKHFRTSLSHLCSTCGKKYANKADLQYHESTKHRLDRLFICPICSKGFCHKKSLECHLTSHTNLRNFSCSKCDMTFKTQGTLYNHEKRHKISSDQEFVCLICDQKFAQKVYYERHVKLLHSSMEKKFKCETCGKMYKHKISLEQHQRVHTGQLFECSQCARSYKSKNKLNDHFRISHEAGAKKQFSCNLCRAAFFVNAKLNRHLKNVHKVEATLDGRKFLKVNIIETQIV